MKKATIVILCSSAFGVTLGLFVKKAISELSRGLSDHTVSYVTKTKSRPAMVQTRRTMGRNKARAIPDLSEIQAQNLSASLEAAEDDRTVRMNTYAGTRIVPGAALPRNLMGLQNEIGIAFARLDLQPPERIAHFHWVRQDDALNPVGWIGYITKLEREGGGWLLEIKVKPMFEQPGGITETGDWCIERYFYHNGALSKLPYAHAHPNQGALFRD